MVPMLSSVMVRPSRCGGDQRAAVRHQHRAPWPVEKPISANTTSSSGTGSVPSAASSTSDAKQMPSADQDRHLVAAEQPVARPPEERAEHLRQRRDEQDVAAALEVVAVDMGEIRPAPEPDDQHVARIARELHQEDAAHRRRADHLPDAGDAFAQRLLARRGLQRRADRRRRSARPARRSARRMTPTPRNVARQPTLAVAKASGAVAKQRAERADAELDAGRRSRTAPAETSAHRARAAPSGTRRCRSPAARARRPDRRRRAPAQTARSPAP